MNEVTSLLLLYTMLGFTDWIDDQYDRYNIGWPFSIIISLNLSIHLFFLGKGILSGCKTKIDTCRQKKETKLLKHKLPAARKKVQINPLINPVEIVEERKDEPVLRQQNAPELKNCDFLDDLSFDLREENKIIPDPRQKDS